MPQSPVSTAVLITGCSSGIGRATAIHLARAGWTVYATARRPADVADLADAGCRRLGLDVCDDASMRQAVGTVLDAEGAVGVLVNNAGYGLEAPVEETLVDELRREFETNLIGPTLLTQLVLPGMRRQGWGKVVNVSSVGGRITIPGGGAYHASKHALEAMSDALRFEVRGFGVDVIVIEPGAIRSRWVDTAVDALEQGRRPGSLYLEFRDAVAARLRGAHEGVLARASAGPEQVALVVERAITTPRPRARYPVPAAARLFIAGRRWLPDPAWDWFMRRLFPSPGCPTHHLTDP